MISAPFLDPVSSFAASVTLAWDANSDAEYYEVYWSTENGVPQAGKQSGNIGNVTEYEVKNLDEGVTYYFSVKAFNSCGNSSDFSDWIEGTATSSTTTDPALSTYIYVSTTSPGAKSTDAFLPPTLSSLVEFESDKPTIDVRDNQLTHLLWLRCGWDAYNNVNGEARIATGDIDGDGKDEVILGLSNENAEPPTMPGGFFQVLDDNYGHIAWGRVEWADYNEANGETWPACGDVDGDGKDEIIIGFGKNGGGYVEIFGLVNGEIVHKVWLRLQWPDYNEINGEVRPVCADVNGDKLDDVIAGLGSIGGDPDIPGGRFEVFSKSTGEWVHLLWGFVDWPEYAEMNGETWPETGDVDGDGKTELVVGLGKGGDGQMAVFEFENGEALQSDWVQIEWPEYNDVSGETRPVCGDVDKDGKDEVIIGWSMKDGDDTAHYFKVLTYNTASGSWTNFKDTKSSDVVDIDSLPVKGAVDENVKIYISTSPKEEESFIATVIKKATGSGGGGGGGGCFIGSAE